MSCSVFSQLFFVNCSGEISCTSSLISMTKPNLALLSVSLQKCEQEGGQVMKQLLDFGVSGDALPCPDSFQLVTRHITEDTSIYCV